MSVLMNNRLRVVYYPSVVPFNPYTVTMLGVLFDEVIFPGVYLRTDVSSSEIYARISLLLDIRRRNKKVSYEEDVIPIRTLLFLRDYGVLLGEVFSVTGKAGYMGMLEHGAQPVIMELEQKIFGPPPENFTPSPSLGYNYPVGSSQINAPSLLAYPANAFLYSRGHGIPLMSDSTFFPFPEDAIEESKDKAGSIASYLLASSFSLILPRLRPLNAEEILDVKQNMSDDIMSFRSVMFSAVARYSILTQDSIPLDKLEKEVKFIAQTEINPVIERLRMSFEKPSKIAFKKFLDLASEAPELALGFQDPNAWPWAIVKILSSISKKTKEGIAEHQEQMKKEKDSGLSLLLKLPRKYSKTRLVQ